MEPIKDLQKYATKYYDTPLVPFPNPEEAVDAIIETMSYVGNWEKEIQFVDEVIRLLNEWKEMRG